MRLLYKIMLGIALLAVPLFVMGGVWADAHGVTGVLGGIGWFGFQLCALVLIVLALAALGKSILRRTTTA